MTKCDPATGSDPIALAHAPKGSEVLHRLSDRQLLALDALLAGAVPDAKTGHLPPSQPEDRSDIDHRPLVRPEGVGQSRHLVAGDDAPTDVGGARQLDASARRAATRSDKTAYWQMACRVPYWRRTVLAAAPLRHQPLMRAWMSAGVSDPMGR